MAVQALSDVNTLFWADVESTKTSYNPNAVIFASGSFRLLKAEAVRANIFAGCNLVEKYAEEYL